MSTKQFGGIQSTGTVVVIHHNDRDGILSAACVYSYISFLPELYTMKFISANYTKSINDMLYNQKDLDMEDVKQIWIVDYSISNDVNANDIIKLQEKYEVYWIDHHYSSLEYINKIHTEMRDNLSKIKGLRINGIAACALTYIYTEYLKFMSDIENYSTEEFNNRILSMIGTVNIYSTYKTLEYISDTKSSISPNSVRDLLDNLNVPDIIFYAHRYDTFDLDDDVISFSYGEYNDDPSDKYTVSMIEKHGDISPHITSGQIIQNYIKTQDKQHADECGFECTVILIDMTERGKREKTTFKVFAMNTTHFSSFAFGGKLDQYDICIPFIFTGDKYKYSMYTNKDNINVGELCSYIRGDGHANAAGFSTDTLVLSKDCTFNIIKRN